MTVPVITVTPDTQVPDIAKLLLDKGISGVPVIDADGRLVGIVSEGDLLQRPEIATVPSRSWWLKLVEEPARHAAQYIKTHGLKASDIMVRHVVTATPATPVEEMAELMEKHRIKRLPVVESGEVVGIVSRANIVRCLASRSSRITPPSATDVHLRERLLKLLEREDLPGGEQVNPIVEDGVIHLWGTVNTEQERQAVRVAAETIAGDRAVQNHLGVYPKGAVLLG